MYMSILLNYNNVRRNKKKKKKTVAKNESVIIKNIKISGRKIVGHVMYNGVSLCGFID